MLASLGCFSVVELLYRVYENKKNGFEIVGKKYEITSCVESDEDDEDVEKDYICYISFNTNGDAYFHIPIREKIEKKYSLEKLISTFVTIVNRLGKNQYAHRKVAPNEIKIENFPCCDLLIKELSQTLGLSVTQPETMSNEYLKVKFYTV